MSELLPIKEQGHCSRCQKDGEVVGLQFIGEGVVGATPLLCTDCLLNPNKVIPLEMEVLEADTPKRVISHSRRKRVAEQEQDMARVLGGRTQAGSGAVAGLKGDVRKKGLFRVECKSTENKSFKMTRVILDKIRSECSPTEKPALDVLFVDPTTLVEEDRWVAIPFPQFEEYAEYAARHAKRSGRT